MRLRAILFVAVVFAGAGWAAWETGGRAAAWFESATATELAGALDAAGLDWATVTADGLKVTLAGAAPDEPSRFRAHEIVRQIVAEARITDATTVAASPVLAPPPFALELLRNEDEVSLIGLVPETGGRDVIRSALGAGGLAGHVTDMLESASDPAPDGWREALGYALAVLAELPRAKVSVAPGKVAVIAVADDDPARAALALRLERGAPAGVALDLDISAPRPVIAPFAFDATLAGGRLSVAACSADSEEAAARIVSAAKAAGAAEAAEAAGDADGDADGGAECAVGLGAPSPDWAAAVERGLAALTELGGGRFVLRDLSAELTGPAEVPPERIAAVADRLDRGLPDVFQLRTVVPPRMVATADGGQAYAPEFVATLGPDGIVRLTGGVKDPASRTAIATVAAALFGHERVLDETAVDPQVPAGWPGRVLAGVEALAKVKEGELTVTPAAVSIRGWGIEPGIAERVRTELSQKVGTEAEVDVTFNAAAARAAALAARPRPEVCADQIAAIMESDSIRFGKGSAEIEPESRGLIAAIADVLRGCPGAEFEIAGHTDSQGDPAANQALSEARAQAVVAALEGSDLPLVRLHARGYGAVRPIADNASDAGRAQNRRIEFVLAPPGGFADETAAPAAAPDEAAAPVVDPATATCASEIAGILETDSIVFAAGSATIAPESRPTIAKIAAALKGCPDAAFEVGGHTDAQGSEAGNLRLSEDRARAVLGALRSDALPLLAMTAKGYGESEPVADNATEEGRTKNRRIAFTLPALAAAGADTAPAGESGDPEDGDVDGDGADLIAAAQSGDPTEVCLARIGALLSENTIDFAAGSAEIAPESAPIVNALAGILRGCPDARLEVGGHTDSTGSDSGNLALSQRRAEAVLAAVRRTDLPLPGLTARGYGESEPVADNRTSEGRAQNRRIAFEPVAEEGAIAEGDGGDDDGSQ